MKAGVAVVLSLLLLALGRGDDELRARERADVLAPSLEAAATRRTTEPPCLLDDILTSQYTRSERKPERIGNDRNPCYPSVWSPLWILIFIHLPQLFSIRLAISTVIKGGHWSEQNLYILQLR